MNRLDRQPDTYDPLHLLLPTTDMDRRIFASEQYRHKQRTYQAAELLRNEDLEQEYVVDSRGLVVLFLNPESKKSRVVTLKSSQMSLKEYFLLPLYQEEDLD